MSFPSLLASTMAGAQDFNFDNKHHRLFLYYFDRDLCDDTYMSIRDLHTKYSTHELYSPRFLNTAIRYLHAQASVVVNLLNVALDDTTSDELVYDGDCFSIPGNKLASKDYRISREEQIAIYERYPTPGMPLQRFIEIHGGRW